MPTQFPLRLEAWIGVQLVLALTCLAGGAIQAFALDPEKAAADYVIRRWTEDDGLPHRMVYAVHESQDGYIWLGTQGGLARFDGTAFTTFDAASQPEVFVEASIRDICHTPDGTLWIVPLHADLLERRSGVLKRLSGLLPADWIAIGVSAVFADSKGTLWLSAGEGIARLAGDGRLEVIAEAGGRSTRRRIVEDKQGRILFTTGERIQRVEAGRVSTVATLPQARVLHVDPRGVVWVGTSGGGLFQLAEGSLIPVPIIATSAPKEKLDITSIVTDRDENLWVGTNGGLLRLKQGSTAQQDMSLIIPGLVIDDLTEDREGHLWVAARSELAMIDDPPFRVFALGGGQSSPIAVTEDALGRLWFVTREAPYLQSLDAERRKVTAFSGDALPAQIETVFCDRRGRLWLGAASGLYRLEGKRWTPVAGTPPGPITTITEDPTGQLWLADASGAVHHQRVGGYETFDQSRGLPGRRRVERLHVARDGAVWITTQDGVYRVEKGVLGEVRLVDNKTYRAVRPIWEDAEGAIWLGTRAGIVRRKGDEERVFGLKEGLPDTIIHGIVGDERGYVWIGCSKGIVRVAKSDFDDLAAGRRAVLRYVLFGGMDGIQQAGSNAAFRARDGSLWFQTGRGLAGIPSTRQPPRSTPVPVFIEEVLVDGKALDLHRAGVTPPGPGRLELRFTALRYEAPQRVRFRYRLDGYDTDWHEAEGNRSVTYPRLGPGAYTIRVQAYNAAEAWEPSERTYSFSHRPHIYQMAVVRALGLVALAFLAFVAYRYRIAALLRRQAERELLMAELERKNEELERFTYTVSHDLKSPLVTILGFLGFAERWLDAGDTARARGDFERIRSAAERMDRLLKELLQLSRIGRVMAPHQDVPFETLAREVVVLLDGAISASGALVQIEGGLPTVWGDPGRLREVLQNLLENAIRFGARDRHPRIVVGSRGTDEAGHDVLFVRDNGIGIDPRHRERIFRLFEKLDAKTDGTGVGLTLVKRIIEVHGGKVWVESEGEHGSTFFFTLPRRKPQTPR